MLSEFGIKQLGKVLFASDYDGTITVDGIVPNYNHEAIRRFRKTENLFCVVTGRGYSAFLPEKEKNNLDYDLLSCNNGAILYDKNGNVVYQKEFAEADAKKIIDFLKEESKARTIGICSPTEICYAIEKEGCKLPDYIPISKVDPDNFLKNRITGLFSVYDNTDDMMNARNKMAAISDCCEILVSSPVSIDIGPKGVDKGLTVRELKKIYSDYTVCVSGDSPNDIPMFLNEKNSFVVAAGSDELKEVASFEIESLSDVLNEIVKLQEK